MKHFFQTLRIRRLFSKEVLVFFFITLILFLINAFHEKYPDEFDNILGGWYILRGMLPYIGFFTHHGPGAYFIAAFIQIFSGHSFISFRVVYSIFLVLGIFAWYFYLQSRFGRSLTKFYLYFSLLIGISATYFWGHMLLADSICGYLFAAVYILFVLKYIHSEKWLMKDVWLISTLTSIALLTSLTYMYVAAFIYLFLFISYYQDHKHQFLKKHFLTIFVSIALPYLIFFVYLAVTGSIKNYIYQAITFNANYYIYTYPNLHNGHINPIRFAIVLFRTFYNNFYTLLLQTNFNFNFPFNVTLAIVNLTMLVYTLFRRNYQLFLFIVLFMVYANARSNPLNSKETDYQSAVYIMMSLLNISFLLPSLYNELHSQINQGKKVVLGALFLLSLVYTFFTIGMLTDKFMEKSYNKYMGTAPLIYDESYYAGVVNAVTTDNDYIWIGPFAFQDYFYTHGKLASQYHILIPDMAKSPIIPQEFLADMNAHQPKVIIFNSQYFILGSNPAQYGQYFVQFLKQDYVKLSDVHMNGVSYVQTSPITGNYNINDNLYINKTNVQEVVSKLLARNFIQQVYGSTH